MSESAPGSVKPGAQTSTEEEPMDFDVRPEVPSEDECESMLDRSLRDVLEQFTQHPGGDIALLNLRPLIAIFERLGYVLEERLPPIENLEARDLSVFGYLQIAERLPSTNIVALNLDEFNQLVTDVVKRQYSVYSRSFHPQNIEFKTLMEMARILVRDPVGVLRGEPETKPKETATSSRAATQLLPVAQSYLQGFHSALLAAAQQSFPAQPKSTSQLGLTLSSPPIGRTSTAEPQRKPRQPTQTSTASAIVETSLTQVSQRVSETEEELLGSVEGEFNEPSGFSPSNLGEVLQHLPPIQTPKVTATTLAPRKAIQEPKTDVKKAQRDRSSAHHKKEKRSRKSKPQEDEPYVPSTATSATEVGSPTVGVNQESAGASPTSGRAPRLSKTVAMEKTKSLYAKKQQKDEEETVSEKETEKSQKKEESDSVSDLSDDSDGEINIRSIEKKVHEKEAAKKRARRKGKGSKSAKTQETSAETTTPKSQTSAGQTSAKGMEASASATASATAEPTGTLFEDDDPDDPVPEYVAVPGRREKLWKEKKIKLKISVFHAANLSAALAGIYTDVQPTGQDYFENAAGAVKRRWSDAYAFLKKVDYARTQAFMAEVQWRVVVHFHERIWKTFGIRLAEPNERATFNFLATFPRELVPYDRLYEKARKDIGETAQFLEDCAENRLVPRDIWMRIVSELDGLDGFNRSLIALEGRERTAIVASGLSNAFAIFKLLDEFGVRSTRWNASICHVDFADGGTLKLAKMAYEVLSWHFGLEDLVVVALDMGAKARCAREGVRPVPDKGKTIQYYLGSKFQFYNPNLDIDRVETSCSEEIIKRLKANKNTQTLGNDVQRWRRNETTRHLRIPAVFAFAGCSTGFMKLGGKGDKPTRSYLDEEQLDQFIRVFQGKSL